MYKIKKSINELMFEKQNQISVQIKIPVILQRL